MAMNVLQSPSRPVWVRCPVSSGVIRGWGCFTAAWPANVVWHCLFRLAADTVMAGILYFDDFTMSVTPELTLANIRALFNPANYDIILRTLTMAVAVTIASAILAFSMAWYMARYTSGKMKAFFILR